MERRSARLDWAARSGFNRMLPGSDYQAWRKQNDKEINRKLKSLQVRVSAAAAPASSVFDESLIQPPPPRPPKPPPSYETKVAMMAASTTAAAAATAAASAAAASAAVASTSASACASASASASAATSQLPTLPPLSDDEIAELMDDDRTEQQNQAQQHAQERANFVAAEAFDKTRESGGSEAAAEQVTHTPHTRTHTPHTRTHTHTHTRTHTCQAATEAWHKEMAEIADEWHDAWRMNDLPRVRRYNGTAS